MAHGPSTSSSAVTDPAMSRLNTFGCPPIPAFRKASAGDRKKNPSEEVSDSDSLGNFNPYGAVLTTWTDDDKRKTKKKRRKGRKRSDGALLSEIKEQIACPCCWGYQRMEVVPGLWYQLEGGAAKRAWHWIGNPLQAWSVLVPLAAVPLSAASTPTTPPPLALLHMAVFPAGVFHRMLRDSNLVLCMVIAPPPHSVGAWYSIDQDGDGDKGGGGGEGAAVVVSVSRSSSCHPWYTTTAPCGGGDYDGCWIWFPVPPPPSPDNTVNVKDELHEEEQEEEDGEQKLETLVLGRWMTETLRSADH